MNQYVIGIDEAGRGPWAGPIVAAAVMLRSDDEFEGLNDSKQMSARQREAMLEQIRYRAYSIGIGWVSAAHIDEAGISAATGTAMRRAYKQLTDEAGCLIVIDGTTNFLADITEAQAQAGADGSVAAVSAASVVAKVCRDRYMQSAAKLYPDYGFERHKGYGTKAHQQAVTACGPCAIHRRSFAPIKQFKEIQI